MMLQPGRCMVCGEALDDPDERLCRWCRKELRSGGNKLLLAAFIALATGVAGALFSLSFLPAPQANKTAPPPPPVFGKFPASVQNQNESIARLPRVSLPDVWPDLFPCPLGTWGDVRCFFGMAEAVVKLATPVSRRERALVREVKKPPKKAADRKEVPGEPPESPFERLERILERASRNPRPSPPEEGEAEPSVGVVPGLVSIDFLRKMQKADGTWSSGFRIREYDMGATALAVTALLYAGEARDSDCIKKAFSALRDWCPRMTYTAGIALMMVEAYCADRNLVGEAFRREMRRRFREAPVWMRRLARNAYSLLLRSQSPSGFWAYGPLGMGHTHTDLSNTQFGAFGLYAAANLGIRVPKTPFRRLLSALLAMQQKRGASIARPFDVPLARLHPSALRTMERDAVRGSVRAQAGARVRTRAVAEENLSRRVDAAEVRAALRTAVDGTKEKDPPAMVARGFAYRNSTKYKPTVAMTASGLGCLAICKVMLNSDSRFLNRAIRDAAAWLALNMKEGAACSVVHKGIRYFGPGYAAYAVCRAAVLTGVRRFGDVDWRECGGWGGCGAVEEAFRLLAFNCGVVGFVGGVGGF